MPSPLPDPPQESLPAAGRGRSCPGSEGRLQPARVWAGGGAVWGGQGLSPSCPHLYLTLLVEAPQLLQLYVNLLHPFLINDDLPFQLAPPLVGYQQAPVQALGLHGGAIELPAKTNGAEWALAPAFCREPPRPSASVSTLAGWQLLPTPLFSLTLQASQALRGHPTPHPSGWTTAPHAGGRGRPTFSRVSASSSL